MILFYFTLRAALSSSFLYLSVSFPTLFFIRSKQKMKCTILWLIGHFFLVFLLFFQSLFEPKLLRKWKFTEKIKLKESRIAFHCNLFSVYFENICLLFLLFYSSLYVFNIFVYLEHVERHDIYGKKNDLTLMDNTKTKYDNSFLNCIPISQHWKHTCTSVVWSYMLYIQCTSIYCFVFDYTQFSFSFSLLLILVSETKLYFPMLKSNEMRTSLNASKIAIYILFSFGKN